MVNSAPSRPTTPATPITRRCFKSGSGFARLQSPMALSASIDDETNIACFGLRALGLFAWALADDPLLKHLLREFVRIFTVLLS